MEHTDRDDFALLKMLRFLVATNSSDETHNMNTGEDRLEFMILMIGSVLS